MKTSSHVCGVLLALLLLQGAAEGSTITVPLRFGMNQGVSDEFGLLLPGTAASPGALVQILGADGGVYPPAANGAPHPNNPVLAEAFIGQGTDPIYGLSGKVFGSVLINRSAASKVFARIYNRPAREDASFYADSPVYTNSTTTYGIFTIAAVQTDKPIDDGDDDGDGLINSWERSLGTDPLNPDSDGDGISDYHEFLAGTNPLDVSDNLAMVEMIPHSGDILEIQWDSVPGKWYQLQCTHDLSGPNPVYEDVNDPVEASDYKASTTMTNVSATGVLHFRILLLE